MSNSNSNYPGGQIARLNGTEFTKEAVASLMDLSEQGKPKADEELQQRISDFFRFCCDRGFRPGVEALCLALSISRQTMNNWLHGVNCSAERQEIIIKARQGIIAFIEQASLGGHLNPATSIFLLKNWGGYRDAYELEPIQEKQCFIIPAEETRQIPNNAGF